MSLYLRSTSPYNLYLAFRRLPRHEGRSSGRFATTVTCIFREVEHSDVHSKRQPTDENITMLNSPEHSSDS